MVCGLTGRELTHGEVMMITMVVTMTMMMTLMVMIIWLL